MACFPHSQGLAAETMQTRRQPGLGLPVQGGGRYRPPPPKIGSNLQRGPCEAFGRGIADAHSWQACGGGACAGDTLIPCHDRRDAKIHVSGLAVETGPRLPPRGEHRDHVATDDTVVRRDISECLRQVL